MRSSWSFQNIPLPIKFAMAVVLLLVGLGLWASAYYQTLRIEESTLARAETLEGFRTNVNVIRLNIADARINEKGLIIEKDLSYLEVFEEDVEKADLAITELHEYIRSEEQDQMIFELHDLLDTYREAVDEGAQAALEIGLTANTGLTAEMGNHLVRIDNLWEWDYFRDIFPRYIELTGEINAFLADASEFGSSNVAAMDLQRTLISAQIDILREELLNAAVEYPQALQTANAFEDMGVTFGYLTDAMATRDTTYANLTALSEELQPQLQSVFDLAAVYQLEDNKLREAEVQMARNSFFISMGFMIVSFTLALVILKLGILDSVSRIRQTLAKIREGDSEARTELTSHDELGELAQALDGLLDDKETNLRDKEVENKRINASIIDLIQNVFRLSQRDLTVRVPVAEDITGAVADSINQLAESIELVLRDVDKVANQVNNASVQVKSQSATVLEYSRKEKEEVGKTLVGLDSAVKAMQIISKLAVLSNSASQRAIKTSETAMESVSQTVDSITKIRQTIHEAEKRIKRLGERSQEIGGIVSLINNISERTHVLSLNASMHAASAGEAGRGLMVVVDEVQRLAENSREATAEIENLVNNIQLETADTIAVMNTVITDVVEGTELAEAAGERMSETRATTQSLVDSVVRIAQNAARQAKVAQELRIRASSIEATTASTNDEMERQALLSDELVNSAAELQRSIRVFKLATDQA
ncbi:MAG: methyl-accepting chemotaxis protein [Pontibacterium sp.]